jgi:hypothetical protein
MAARDRSLADPAAVPVSRTEVLLLKTPRQPVPVGMSTSPTPTPCPAAKPLLSGPWAIRGLMTWRGYGRPIPQRDRQIRLRRFHHEHSLRSICRRLIHGLGACIPVVVAE